MFEEKVEVQDHLPMSLELVQKADDPIQDRKKYRANMQYIYLMEF